MSNMSYCRFQNTLHDLDDCKDAVEELVIDDDSKRSALSREEVEAAVKLVETCTNLLLILSEEMACDIDEVADKRDLLRKILSA